MSLYEHHLLFYRVVGQLGIGIDIGGVPTVIDTTVDKQELIYSAVHNGGNGTGDCHTSSGDGGGAGNCSSNVIIHQH